MESKSNRQKMIDNFLPQVNKTMSTEQFLHKLLACSGNFDRINLVKTFFHWIPSGSKVIEKYKKRSEVSVHFRNKVMPTFEKGDYVGAIHYCSAAILYAETDTDLTLAIYTRSVLLHELKQTDAALEQINLAITIHSKGTSKHPALSILDMMKNLKAKYEKILNADELSSDQEFVTKCGAEKERRKHFCDNLFRLKSQGNPLAPALENFVDIKYNVERGRHLIVTKDIPPGTTLLVEKPFVAGLEGTSKIQIQHCHHCLKRNLNCIPCPDCVFAMFCDEECLKAASAYHKTYECPSLPDLCHILSDDVLCENFYLVFKLICIVGPLELFRIFKEKDEDYFSHENNFRPSSPSSAKILGSDPTTGVYQSSSSSPSTASGRYLPMCHLSSVIKSEEGYFFPLISLMLSHVLDENTNFFEQEMLEIKSSDFREFIAQVILHHFECFRRNVFALGEIEDVYIDGAGIGRSLYESLKSKSKFKLDYPFSSFASACYPTASLLNHSCYPNVERFTGASFGEIAIVSIKSLKKGEELVISYGPVLSDNNETSSGERRHLLSAGYDFTCNCIACRSDWLPGIMKSSKESLTFLTPRSFCCSHCSTKFMEELKSSKEYLQCVMKLEGVDDSKVLKCPSCFQSYDRTIILGQFSRQTKSAQISTNLVLSNSPLEALNALKLCLEFFQNSDIPPSYELIRCQKIYRQALDLIIYYARQK